MSTSPNPERLKQIIEGALLAAGRPLGIDQILALFLDEEQPSRDEIRAAVESLQADCAARGVELVEVSSGYRFQVKSDLAHWIANLYEERPARYSRATLETLALIAYRQPITRSEIEDVRGVAVSSNIVKSLLERDWVRVIGYRDVPGKPALYGTTKGFLDYFGLSSLSDLPPLAEIRSIESIERELAFGLFDEKPADEAANESDDETTESESAEDEGMATAAVVVAGEGDVNAATQTEAVDSLAESADDEEVADKSTTAVVADDEDADDTAQMEEIDPLAESADDEEIAEESAAAVVAEDEDVDDTALMEEVDSLAESTDDEEIAEESAAAAVAEDEEAESLAEATDDDEISEASAT